MGPHFCVCRARAGRAARATTRPAGSWAWPTAARDGEVKARRDDLGDLEVEAVTAEIGDWIAGDPRGGVGPT